jgi:hypothetical protein
MKWFFLINTLYIAVQAIATKMVLEEDFQKIIIEWVV